MVADALAGAATVQAVAGGDPTVFRRGQLLRGDAQLFAAAGTKGVYHQQYQVAVGNLLHTERPVNTTQVMYADNIGVQ